MKLYILISALYRLSCGAIILAVNWIMVKESTSLSWLASTVALTFLPAMIVPILWKENKYNTSGKKITQYSLLVAASTSLVMASTNSHYLVLFFNTILWFSFFVMESSWEAWFASECFSLPRKSIDRYSSVSMTINQSALMIGPIITSYFFEKNPKKIIIICAILYAFCFLISFLSKSKRDKQYASTDLTKTQETSKINISGTEIALLLIWPTLAMFNFMLPAQVASKNGSMYEVGLLDASMGIGMIVSGLIVGNISTNNLFFKFKLYPIFIVLSILIWFLESHIIFRIISVFLLGLVFNAQRILIRGNLVQKYTPILVGKVVSVANSFSFIIISLLLFIFYNNLSLNWAIPFICSLIICLLISIKVSLKEE